MARLVLVHGAFCGAWVWEPLVAPLEAAGHSVETFDLPGAGDDGTPPGQVTLEAYGRRVCEQVASRDEPAVLVGHSMGGIAITQAAGCCPEQIALLIYVAAMLPRGGQSLMDLVGLPEGRTNLVEPNMTAEGDPPVATLSEPGLRAALYGRCDEDQVEWALQRNGAQPVAPFESPVSLTDRVDIPRTFVVCRHDRAVPTALQRRMVRENACVEVVELDADHSPFLSAPAELVEAIDGLARWARDIRFSLP